MTAVASKYLLHPTTVTMLGYGCALQLAASHVREVKVMKDAQLMKLLDPYQRFLAGSSQMLTDFSQSDSAQRRSLRWVSVAEFHCNETWASSSLAIECKLAELEPGLNKGSLNTPLLTNDFW